MTTACIVQARLRSSRLPGKVMEDLGGRTVLSHVLARCRAIHGIDVVVCATVDAADCDPVAAEAERCGAAVFRGDETDVLDRYHKAAQSVGATTVMRVTSDCPLIDPDVCGEVLALTQQAGADYAANGHPPSFPHGLDCEAFSFIWLERAAVEAVRPSEREHVTPYLHAHRDVRRVNLRSPMAGVSHHRWVLDHPEDLDFLRALWPLLPAGRAGWPWRTVLAVVEAHPDLTAINGHLDRHEGTKRSAAEDAAHGFAARATP